MKYKLTLLLLLLPWLLAAQPGNNGPGSTGDHPIKVGTGVAGGPANQRIYLNNLEDIRGRAIRFKRKGSCCQFNSEQAPLGIGSVDIYLIGFFENDILVDSTTLYLTFYEYERPVTPPQGFRFASEDIGDALEINKTTLVAKYGDRPDLSLSFENLETVPDFIFDLIQLEQLSLAYNKLVAVPERIGNLTRLKELELQSNSIKELPEALTSLPQFESITLCSNMNWEQVFSVLSRCKNLKSISFREAGLSAIPGTIRKCQQVVQLDLRGNSKIDYAHGFGVLKDLKSVRELTFDFQTDKIPPGLRYLKQLEVLRISHSNITSLTDEIGNLTNLKELHLLYSRAFKRLPAAVARCKKLTKVSLYSMEKDFDFDYSLRQLKGLNLVYLDLSQAWNMKIPESLTSFTKLKYLGLNIYETDSLPEDIGRLHDLEELVLGPSDFKTLPPGFSQLQSLKKLDLGGRVALDFEQAFVILAALPALEKIDLDWGEQRLPDSIAGMKKIKEIVMTNYERRYVTEAEQARHQRLLPQCTFVYNP